MKAKFIVGAVTALLLLAAVAQADITIKSTVTSKGIVGLTNMEGNTEQMISGGKSKTFSTMKLTNKVMKFMGAGKPQESASIIRLDKELIWELKPKDKEYTEMTFAQMKADMEKALAESQKDKTKYQKEHPNDSVSIRTEFKVDKTGKTQTIAGQNTSETILTMLVYAKNAESGEQGTMKLTMDLWLAKDIPGAEDFKAFHEEAASKLGFTGRGQQSMDGMLTAFGVDPRELYRHTKDLEGMPLMSVVSLGAIPDSTQTAKKGEVKEEKKDTEAEQSDEGSKGGVTKKLGGLFGKKKESKSEEPAKDSKEQQAGPVYLMQFTTTVTEISKASIPASEFDVPADYKLKK